MTIGLQTICGFDDWYAINPITQVGNAFYRMTIAAFQTSTTGGHFSAILVTGGAAGRQARGQSIAMSASLVVNTPTMLLSTYSTGGVSQLPDSANMYFGFNVYLGCTNGGLIPNTGGPTGTGGYCRVWGFGFNSPGAVTGGATFARVAFWYDVGSNSFIATVGSGTPPGGTGTPLVAKASGQPTRNPWQQWTYVECHMYRHATSGSIDMWIENSGGTLDLLLTASGLDTSVATLGNITGPFFGGGWFNTSVWFACEYDDYWLALSGRPGLPSYVVTVPASSGAETSQSGPAVAWAPTPSGGTLGSVVDEIVCDMNDYAFYPITLTGSQGNSMSLLFGQQALPYTPQSITAVQSMCWTSKLNTTSGAPIVLVAQGKGRIRKGATDYDGSGVTLGLVSVTGPLGATGLSAILFLNSILENDPDTSAPWVPATANNVSIGVAVSGQVGTTGAGTAGIAVYCANMQYLQSIAAAASGAPGAPASGFGQPFWVITGYPNVV